ncbi:MAG: class I tRNA ligase family protein, partial [Candidatus Yanofskybacteria bacterium]|nr:class I tRNA ligase family protein [Candidatus Yanofskybacteria bacterium]
KQVKTLIDKGHAYLIEGDGYYFDLSTFKNYGRLSGRTKLMDDDAISRIDENNKKKNKGDFCLWKLSKPDEPSWDTELGKGRPGWHIEDTAITEHYFGPQYDIHGGGQDLIFPHHEAEITQQESASGKKPFVKYWMHVAFLVNKDQKMSKSLGNFEAVNELLKKYPKEVLRFYLLSNHYRSPLDYSNMAFAQSQAAIYRISEFIDKLSLADGKDNHEADISLSETREKFIKSMSDDFNTPEAFGSLFEMIRVINPLLVDNKISKKQSDEILEFMRMVNLITGVIPSEKQKIPAEVQELVEQREKLRQDKNYEESDKIRAQIHDLGWEIEDTIYGPLVVKK